MFLTSSGKAKHKCVRQGFYDSRGNHGINVQFYNVHGFILLISNYKKSKNASPHSVLIYVGWQGKKCKDKLMHVPFEGTEKFGHNGSLVICLAVAEKKYIF